MSERLRVALTLEADHPDYTWPGPTAQVLPAIVGPLVDSAASLVSVGQVLR